MIKFGQTLQSFLNIFPKSKGKKGVSSFGIEKSETLIWKKILYPKLNNVFPLSEFGA